MDGALYNEEKRCWEIETEKHLIVLGCSAEEPAIEIYTLNEQGERTNNSKGDLVLSWEDLQFFYLVATGYSSEISNHGKLMKGDCDEDD